MRINPELSTRDYYLFRRPGRGGERVHKTGHRTREVCIKYLWTPEAARKKEENVESGTKRMTYVTKTAAP